MYNRQSAAARAPPGLPPWANGERGDGYIHSSNFTNCRRHSAAHANSEEGVTMKKLMMILLAGCALVVSQGFHNVAAADGGTPLRKLAGTYALTYQASVAVCFANSAPVPCSTPNATVARFQALSVSTATFDAAGNFCIAFTEIDNDLPLDASPTTVNTFNAVGHITHYDPTTGTGDKSETSYSGGHCHGVTFDSTGATALGTSTSHFVVSNHGKRIDGAATSLSDPTIGSFSVPFTFLRQ